MADENAQTELEQMKKLYEEQAALISTLASKLEQVDKTLLERARKPKRVTALVKEFEATEELLYMMKREFLELDVGQEEMATFWKGIQGMMARRLEFLLTADSYGDEAARTFKVMAAGISDTTALMSLGMKAGSMAAKVRPIEGRSRTRIKRAGDRQSSSGQKCERCGRTNHKTADCFLSSKK